MGNTVLTVDPLALEGLEVASIHIKTYTSAPTEATRHIRFQKLHHTFLRNICHQLVRRDDAIPMEICR